MTDDRADATALLDRVAAGLHALYRPLLSRRTLNDETPLERSRIYAHARFVLGLAATDHPTPLVLEPIAERTVEEHVRAHNGHLVVRNAGEFAWCSKRGCGWQEQS